MLEIGTTKSYESDEIDRLTNLELSSYMFDQKIYNFL